MNISFKYEQLYVLNASATSKCIEESVRIHAVSPGPSLPIRTLRISTLKLMQRDLNVVQNDAM